jgi:hypothetical protein
MSRDVADWRRRLGVGRYADAFRDNEIYREALPRLTAEDLSDLGVVLGGHRRRLLDAIAALAEGERPAEVPPSGAETGGRAAPADGHVLRSGRLDPAGGALRPRGFARGDRRLSPLHRDTIARFAGFVARRARCTALVTAVGDRSSVN